METLKVIKAYDAYQIFKVSYEALYSSLKRLLPSDQMIFAEPKKGVEQVFWVHSSTGWKSYIEADSSLQGLIKGEVLKHQVAIQSILASQPNIAPLLDAIFTIPGDEFYYFRISESEDLEVMITGWGYKKTIVKPVGPGAIPVPKSKTQRVVVSFSSSGQQVPNYSFVLQIKSLTKSLVRVTDEEGLFVLSDQASVGSEYQVYDPLTERSFDLLVEEGKERYDFDVTIETPIVQGDITENKDVNTEKPESPELKPESVDSPVKDDPEIHANAFTDNATVQIEPTLRVIGSELQTMRGFPVIVSYEGQQWSLLTDEDGIIKLPVMTTGKTMSVEDGIMHNTSCTYLLECGQIEYIFQLPFTMHNGNRDILIRTEDENGLPFSGIIAFCQNNRSTVLAPLDESGQCWLDNNDFMSGEELIANTSAAKAISTPNLPNIPFRLKKEEIEYLLTLRQPRKSKNWLEMLSAVLAFIFFMLAYLLFVENL